MERANPQQVARWLARGEQYGWSRGELSRRSGYPAWKLRWWERRFARSRAADARGGGFVAVELTAGSPSAATTGPSLALEVTTPSGHRVAVPRDFDAEHLRRVLQALAASC